MTQSTKFILAFASLLISGAFGSTVQSAYEPRAKAQEISHEVLQQRYQNIWEEVDGSKVPPMVVHLGASAGNRISVWAKSENDRNAAKRDWVLDCHGAGPASVKEEVHDPRFGVSLLTITRNDGNAAPLPCSLKMGGSEAPLIVPVLSPPDQKPFSFLAYSCNEPFSTKDRKGILARDLSLWLRMDARAMGENSRGQLPERPLFVLGVGDQIYVDPDADAKGKERVSFFTGKRSDTFLIEKDEASLYEVLDVVYRYNFSLPPLASALSKLPSYMMWDDHEIRDGWGSQGDELTDPAMVAYFPIARHAFIAHQLLRSYAPGKLKQEEYEALRDGNETLHRQFSHGERTHVLMLDSRSTRPDKKIFEKTARNHVQDWLARGQKGQGDLYVLTVGVPLFPSRTRAGTLARTVEPEIKDDLLDGWDSDLNNHSRAELLEMLANHFEANKNDRLLVISGDVHYSSLYFIALNDRVVGHEVVTSGIAHSLPGIARATNWLLDSGKQVGRFEVRPAGKINNSASFAELRVDLGATGQPPKVDLVFHLNGTKTRRGWPFRWLSHWRLANTNLLETKNQTLWYYTYRYDYTNDDEFAHLAAANSEAYSRGATPAGTIMPLPLTLPQVRTKDGELRRLSEIDKVWSAIQAQSVFCAVNGTDYNKELAKDWRLTDLQSCERLTR